MVIDGATVKASYIGMSDMIFRNTNFVSNCSTYYMARRRKAQTDSAARAREAKARKKGKKFDRKKSDTELIAESLNDDECTSWTGGISHILSDSEDSDEDVDWEDTDENLTSEMDEDSDSDEDLDLEELEGQDLVEALKKYWELEMELQKISQPTPYELLLQKRNLKPQEWKKVEARRGLGYDGLSDRRKREIKQQLRKKGEKDKLTRER
jgi:hypothetical protein